MSASTCAKCHDPLVHEIDDSDNEDMQLNPAGTPGTGTVPDDVQLPCNDHFHWECLLDSYELSKCPACNADITSSPASGSSAQQQQQPQILVNYHNEGGTQENLDIFPILQEESYLRAYPEERKSRAFLEFCREGDHKAIVDLLQSGDDEDSDDDDDDDDQMDTSSDNNTTTNTRTAPLSGPSKTPAEILRYQDSLGGMQSGLHAAVANGHREVAYLLLLLASSMPEIDFPPIVFQEAAAMGMMREDQDGLVDIRSLKDEAGRTAEDVARQMEGGVVWNGWVGNGRLAMP